MDCHFNFPIDSSFLEYGVPGLQAFEFGTPTLGSGYVDLAYSENDETIRYKFANRAAAINIIGMDETKQNTIFYELLDDNDEACGEMRPYLVLTDAVIVKPTGEFHKRLSNFSSLDRFIGGWPDEEGSFDAAIDGPVSLQFNDEDEIYLTFSPIKDHVAAAGNTVYYEYNLVLSDTKHALLDEYVSAG